MSGASLVPLPIANRPCRDLTFAAEVAMWANHDTPSIDCHRCPVVIAYTIMAYIMGHTTRFCDSGKYTKQRALWLVIWDTLWVYDFARTKQGGILVKSGEKLRIDRAYQWLYDGKTRCPDRPFCGLVVVRLRSHKFTLDASMAKLFRQQIKLFVIVEIIMGGDPVCVWINA